MQINVRGNLRGKSRMDNPEIQSTVSIRQRVNTKSTRRNTNMYHTDPITSAASS